VLSELRARANYLIVATAAVATLFGGLLLRGSSIPRGISLAAAMPLIVLLAGFLYALGVLRPTGKQGVPGKLTLVASVSAILDLGGNDVVSAQPGGLRSGGALGLQPTGDRAPHGTAQVLGGLSGRPGSVMGPAVPHPAASDMTDKNPSTSGGSKASDGGSRPGIWKPENRGGQDGSKAGGNPPPKKG
jgi:hypothetical protein